MQAALLGNATYVVAYSLVVLLFAGSGFTDVMGQITSTNNPSLVPLAQTDFFHSGVLLTSVFENGHISLCDKKVWSNLYTKILVC